MLVIHINQAYGNELKFVLPNLYYRIFNVDFLLFRSSLNLNEILPFPFLMFINVFFEWQYNTKYNILQDIFNDLLY